MRAWLLSSLLVLSSLLAGCGGEGKEDEGNYARLSEAAIALPDGAVLKAVAGGLAATWAHVQLPLVREFAIPEGATMVRAVAESNVTSIGMVNADTGRRRCNNPSVEDFTAGFGYPKSCSSLTVLDEPGSTWRVTFNAPAGTNTVDNAVLGAAPPPPVFGKVRIEYLDVPYDGLLAGLDLSAIDPPTQGLQETEVEFLPSHDGVLLRTERTLPEGPGPFPAIIVSSPYYDDGVRATPADWNYVVQDWARRGYAMVTADVRGFGDSGGCVEVWGRNEQLDQKFLVDWVAAQPWSNGRVGFYGQSYVGTTPVAAAVQAPEALKAIVTIAPVISAYEDWHHGGVPNGESELSPVAYQVTTDQTVTGAPGMLAEGNVRDPRQILNNAANGPCDPTLVARANDPRATYDAFYEERDFKLRAKDVKAAVLYTEGFEDANVKSSMIPGWFNELQAPKLGLFGHWLHQHPSRLDCEALFVGWMEHYVKGKDLGFDRLPQVAVQVDRETHRVAQEWPPSAPVETALHPVFGEGTLAAEPSSGSAQMRLDSVGVVNPSVPGAPDEISFETTVGYDTSLAGVATVRVVGTLTGAANAYLAAALYDDNGTGEPRLVTWGQFNLAHRQGHDQFVPVTPGSTVTADLPMLPTEHVFRAGTRLTLVLSGVTASDATHPGGVGGVTFTWQGGPDGTALVIPGVPMSEYEPIPLTARP